MKAQWSRERSMRREGKGREDSGSGAGVKKTWIAWCSGRKAFLSGSLFNDSFFSLLPCTISLSYFYITYFFTLFWLGFFLFLPFGFLSSDGLQRFQVVLVVPQKTGHTKDITVERVQVPRNHRLSLVSLKRRLWLNCHRFTVRVTTGFIVSKEDCIKNLPVSNWFQRLVMGTGISTNRFLSSSGVSDGTKSTLLCLLQELPHMTPGQVVWAPIESFLSTVPKVRFFQKKIFFKRIFSTLLISF